MLPLPPLPARRRALPLALLAALVAAVVAPARAGVFPPVHDVFQVTPGQAARPLPGDGAAPAGAETCAADPTVLPAGPIDLQQAVTLALCRNPQTRLAWAAVLSQAAQVGVAKAAYLPSLNLTFSRSHDAVDTHFDGTPPTTTHSSIYATGRTAALNWLLLDLGGRQANIEQARQALNAALASQDAAVQTLFGNVAQAYYDTWAAQAAADSAREAEATARETLQAASARLRAGVVTQADELQARAALAQATLNRTRAEGVARLSLGSFAAALGLDARSPIELVGDPALTLSTASVAPGDAPSLATHLGDLDSLMSQALEDHPSVRAARGQLAAAQARLNATVSDGLPSISASVGRYINGRPTTPLTPERSYETLTSVTLQVPLFDGFARNYRIRDSQSQVSAREADLANARVQASLEVWRSYQTLQSEAQALAAAADLVRGATAVAEAARGRYRSGTVDILEMVTAERDLANARQERIRALAAWRSSRLKLLANLGRVGFWALTESPAPQ